MFLLKKSERDYTSDLIAQVSFSFGRAWFAWNKWMMVMVFCARKSEHLGVLT